ncbi:MAG: PP0621 family protein [Betaproteobacteria bacterium]
MSKILVLVLVIALVWWIVRVYRKRVDRRDTPPQVTGEDMVRCSHCGVHLPRSESLTTRGDFYCSADHQRQHLKSD